MIANAMKADEVRKIATRASMLWMDSDLNMLMAKIKDAAEKGKFSVDWDLSTSQTREHHDRIKSEFSAMGFKVSSIHDTALEHGYSPTVTIKW